MAALMVGPGQAVAVSGIYRHSCSTPGQSTLVKGNPAPPTHFAGDVWILVQATQHVGR